MERDEIIALMDKPKAAALIPQYRIVYQQATGKPWKGCMCGSGFSNLVKVCENYANALRKQLENK